MESRIRDIYGYYSREDVQKALMEISENREVVGIFREGAYGKRPNVLNYPQDIMQMIRSKVVAFHGSVERWSQPMSLAPSMWPKDMDNLRIGWDLLIDLDVKLFEHAKIVCRLFFKALEKHGVKSISIKYTGGKSFHMGVPFESFPEKIDYMPTQKQYPKIPKIITNYLKNYVKDDLEKEILKIHTSAEELSKAIGVPFGELLTEDGINVDKIITEAGLFTPRHLFRLPYSLNEKSLLASLPIKFSQLEDFEKDDAKPSEVVVEEKFLNPAKTGDASNLVIEAVDWWAKMQKTKEEKKVKRKFLTKDTIPEEFFPPCIKEILNGLPDGRKRALFILVNFLNKINWKWESTQELIRKWNEKNKPPLGGTYLNTQLRWFERQKSSMLPPNCDTANFYRGMGVCKPDALCRTLKNPVTYSFRKVRKPAKARKRTHDRNVYIDI